MLRRTYDDQVCSIARSLEVVGERWSLLIVRDALLGLRRFEEFQDSLGIARNVLSDRLGRLVTAGVLERVRYQQRPDRFEYRLTRMGYQLLVPVLGLMQWGDEHLSEPGGPPRVANHLGCGGDLRARLICQRCQQPVDAEHVEIVPGPGLRRPG